MERPGLRGLFARDEQGVFTLRVPEVLGVRAYFVQHFAEVGSGGGIHKGKGRISSRVTPA
ncbi:MAG: hypothetical protein IPP33_13260 [Flavobacteriales bacterium]|nr:hypothetical protein [Flavobacteriales bacterium]